MSQPEHTRQSNACKLNDSSSKRAIIVGGGLAGISAALALARGGLRVTLVEAKRRLGGRAGSFLDPVSGETIDYCQHVGMGCCTNLRQLIAWLGQAGQWQIQRELHFYGPDGKHRKLSALPWLPAPLHLAGWLWSWPGLCWSDRWCVARGMRSLNGLQLNDELDRISAFHWLTQQRQTARAIDRFWSTVVVSALGEQLMRVSLLAVAKVFRDGFLRHRDAFHLLLPRSPLTVLFGTEAERLLSSLCVQIELSSVLQNLIWFDGRCCGVRLKDGREVCGDATIMAIPWHRYVMFKDDHSKIELEAAVSSAAEFSSSPISGVHTWWDRPWLETDHAVLIGRLCQWIFPKPAHNYNAASGEHYYQVVISASRELSEYIPPAERMAAAPHAFTGTFQKPSGLDPQLLMHAIHADLAAVFPKASNAKLLRVKAVTDPHAVFSIQPGSGRFRPSVDAIGNGLWLAGDWTQTGWPATMEGAVLSGFLAAERVSAALGSTQAFVVKPLA